MAKNRLGRGLDALIGGARTDETVVLDIPLGAISTNPWQPRKEFDESRLDELAQSIQQHGVLQPVLVKRTGADTYELIAGERRWRAAALAGLRTVPALVRELSNPQMLEVALIENLQREDINPVEAARAYAQLRSEFGLTQEEIARRVGKAQSTIANSLRLLTLPQSVLESISNGELTEGHARAVLAAAPQARAAVAADVVRRKLSVRQAEQLGREHSAESIARRQAEPPPYDYIRPRDPNLAAVEEELRRVLSTRVSLRWMGESGTLEIAVYSQQHLEAIVERLLADGPFV